MAHGKTITIHGLLYGTSYTVTEESGSGYKVEKTNDAGVLTKNKTASFINIKNAIIPTSAENNTSGALGMFTIIGIFGVVWLFKRRKPATN